MCKYKVCAKLKLVFRQDHAETIILYPSYVHFDTPHFYNGYRLRGKQDFGFRF